MVIWNKKFEFLLLWKIDQISVSIFDFQKNMIGRKLWRHQWTQKGK